MHAQIVKELLQWYMDLEKFHHYTYSCFVVVESDHKPLEVIVTKPLHAAPKRLQSLLLRYSKYNESIVYKPGKLMLIADTLSRANLPETEAIPETEDILQLNAELDAINTLEEVAISDEKNADVRIETLSDTGLQTVNALVQNGWPKYRHDVNSTRSKTILSSAV